MSSPMIFEFVMGAVVMGIVVLFVAYLMHRWNRYDAQRWSKVDNVLNCGVEGSFHKETQKAS